MKKKKREFNLREEYSKSWDYIKESKNFIYLIIAIFFVFALIGFFIPAPTQITEQILKFIQELLEKTQDLSSVGLIKFIFLNNLQSSFMSMIFGVLLGVFPLVATIANGYLLGFVASIAVSTSEISVLFKLLPHGIFELPAIFISLGLGLKFGTFIFQNNRAELFRYYLWSSLRVFFFIIVPLLIIAAIIEGSFIFLFG